MRFRDLVDLVGDEPLFETGLLLVGSVNPADIRRQLSRWTTAGRIHQLRRGLYALAPPYRKVEPHPFLVANLLAPGSYVSLQAALAYYGLIPEYVPVVTSVGNVRPSLHRTPSGDFLFRHLKSSLFWGYEWSEVASRQHAFLATPEKSLLDLVYLQPDGGSAAYLNELRLQNLERLDCERFQWMAERSGAARLQKAASIVINLAAAEAEAYLPL